jgi:RNA polymerase subunit RPABC4/transcription elongation factor Spt4
VFTCPSCEQTINPASEICPYCHAEIVPVKPAAHRQEQRRGLLITITAALAVVGGILAVFYFVLPKPNVAPPAIAESAAVAALRQAASAVQSYAHRVGGYPDTIVQVQDQVNAAFSSARGHGYNLVYRAGSPGSDGNIHSFVLLARPDYYGYRNFYVDQTGVIRSTRQNRPATAQDPPIS